MRVSKALLCAGGAASAAWSFLVVIGVLNPVLSQAPDLLQPKQHLTIDRPGLLSDAESIALYENIRKQMHAGYALARLPDIARFGEWRRYNSAPYVSATHGQRYVNNYANGIARNYGRYEESGPLPVGSILAKDSFTVIRGGDVFAGALFLMEKMPAGFNAASHDWRYTMIMPDGSFFGTTKGEGSERVGFCITCHEAVPEEHYQMFFVPEAYRVQRLNPQ